jgi:hypothetical protein
LALAGFGVPIDVLSVNVLVMYCPLIILPASGQGG